LGGTIAEPKAPTSIGDKLAASCADAMTQQREGEGKRKGIFLLGIVLLIEEISPRVMITCRFPLVVGAAQPIMPPAWQAAATQTHHHHQKLHC